MTITITAFERSPDGGKGLARDTRVRWALEEVGQPYEVRGVSFRALKEPAHLRLHPFGQIPTYEEGDLSLFETGSIIFHIAEHHPGLLPEDAHARARAITWMFAAVNTVEPPILELANAKILERDKPWTQERLPIVEDRVRTRLAQLSTRLGDAEWLDGAFSAGDLMMVHVLQRLKPSGLLDEFPSLAAYVARGEARPAYRRAFADQAAFTLARRQVADGIGALYERNSRIPAEAPDQRGGIPVKVCRRRAWRSPSSFRCASPPPCRGVASAWDACGR